MEMEKLNVVGRTYTKHEIVSSAIKSDNSITETSTGTASVKINADLLQSNAFYIATRLTINYLIYPQPSNSFLG